MEVGKSRGEWEIVLKSRIQCPTSCNLGRINENGNVCFGTERYITMDYWTV